MIPCSGFIEEVLSTNSARISHPPPFRRVTKNGCLDTIRQDKGAQCV